MQMRQLLLTRSSQPENAFGPYTREILGAEGLNGFQTVDIDVEGMPELLPTDLIVLTRCFLRDAEINQLRAAVERGARLAVLHPSEKLAGRFGWKTLCRAAYPGWARVREGCPGPELPIQAHVPIVGYAPYNSDTDFDVVADAAGADWRDSGWPAVALQRLGAGRIAFFFYDLPKAVARVRFGNPDLASVVTNGLWHWPHTVDLFEGHVDGRVAHLPQAELHCRLLAKTLTDICACPLARFWYYGKIEQPAAAVFCSDDDMSKPDQFRQLADALKSHGAHATFYLMKDTLLSREQVSELREEGHTFAPHVNAIGEADEWAFSFPRRLAEETALLRDRFGGTSASIQAHCAPWLGHMNWVGEFMRHGYRLLPHYFSVPLNTYMCGSGRPLKFVNESGAIYDCWQQPLVSYDDASIKEEMTRRPADILAEFERRVLRPAIGEHNTVIGLSSHPVSYATYSKPYFDALLDLLCAERVPVYNGDEWLDFIDRRNAARISQSTEPDGTIVCAVSGLRCALPLMLPLGDRGMPSVKIDGRPAAAVECVRFGRRHAVVQLEGDGREMRVEFR